MVVLVYILFSFHDLELTLVKSEDDMMLEGKVNTFKKYLKDIDRLGKGDKINKITLIWYKYKFLYSEFRKSIA